MPNKYVLISQHDGLKSSGAFVWSDFTFRKNVHVQFLFLFFFFLLKVRKKSFLGEPREDGRCAVDNEATLIIDRNEIDWKKNRTADSRVRYSDFV